MNSAMQMKPTGPENRPQPRAGNLPWLEEIKDMAHAFDTAHENKNLEDWRLWELDDTRNEVILMALAFHHGWGLVWHGKQDTYVARKTAPGASTVVKAWSFHDRTRPFDPFSLGHAQTYHIRLGVWMEQTGVRHQFVILFGETNPCETVRDYVRGIDFWARRFMAMQVQDMDNLKPPFLHRYPVFDRVTAHWFTAGVFSIGSHQIIQ